jgi:hypothetical protein
MEVTMVSLSAGEQRALSRIANELAASDIKLASMLGVFNRLSSDEEMPERQHTGRESSPSHRTRGRAQNTRLQRRAVKPAWCLLTAWILISTVLIMVMIVTHIGHDHDGRARCPLWWPATCARP